MMISLSVTGMNLRGIKIGASYRQEVRLHRSQREVSHGYADARAYSLAMFPSHSQSFLSQTVSHHRGPFFDDPFQGVFSKLIASHTPTIFVPQPRSDAPHISFQQCNLTFKDHVSVPVFFHAMEDETTQFYCGAPVSPEVKRLDRTCISVSNRVAKIHEELVHRPALELRKRSNPTNGRTGKRCYVISCVNAPIFDGLFPEIIPYTFGR